MQQKHVLKMVLVVPLWAYAAATWALIGHQLAGLPDLAMPAALVAAITASAWMMRGASGSTPGSNRVTNPPTAIAPASKP
jgi:hypothetical protein